MLLPSQNAIINYVQCALKRISYYIIVCMASYYGAPANCLTATLKTHNSYIVCAQGRIQDFQKGGSENLKKGSGVQL